MASTTITRPDLFPAGTVVKLFAAPTVGEAQRNNVGNPESWAPALTKLGEATVASGGGLSFNGFAPGRYLAWAQVNAVDVYLRVLVSQGNAIHEPWAEEESGTAAAFGCKVTTPAGRRRVVTSISASVENLAAVGANKLIAVKLKSGGAIVFQRYLEQVTTAGVGGQSGFAVDVNIPMQPGETVNVECEAGAAEVKCQVNVSGFIE